MEKTYYISKEDFITLKAAWKVIPTPSAADMVIYNILRSKPGVNGFVPRAKRDQYDNEWIAFDHAKFFAHRFVCFKSKTRMWDVVNHYWTEFSVKGHNDIFKTRYGIDLPEGLADLIEAAEHG